MPSQEHIQPARFVGFLYNPAEWRKHWSRKRRLDFIGPAFDAHEGALAFVREEAHGAADDGLPLAGYVVELTPDHTMVRVDEYTLEELADPPARLDNPGTAKGKKAKPRKEKLRDALEHQKAVDRALAGAVADAYREALDDEGNPRQAARKATDEVRREVRSLVPDPPPTKAELEAKEERERKRAGLRGHVTRLIGQAGGDLETVEELLEKSLAEARQASRDAKERLSEAKTAKAKASAQVALEEARETVQDRRYQLRHVQKLLEECSAAVAAGSCEGELELAGPQPKTRALEDGTPYVEGAATSIYYPGARGPEYLDARYALVPSSKVITSHRAGTFGAHPDYPPELQERDYSTDRAEQAKVLLNAQNFIADLQFNSDPTAISGPPIITRRGYVIGGNSRAMTAHLVMRDKPDAYYPPLRRALQSHCATMGLVDAPVEGHMLVRVLEADRFDAASISAQLNRGFTQTLGAAASSVSLARQVPAELWAAIGDELEDDSLGDALRRLSGRIFEALRDAGVITPSNIQQWAVMQKGRPEPLLSKAGLQAVKSAAVGALVGDKEVLELTPPSAATLYERIAPYCLALDQYRCDGEGISDPECYNFVPSLRVAIRELPSVYQMTPAQRTQHYATPELGGAVKPIEADPLAAALLEWLLEGMKRPRRAQDQVRDYWRGIPGTARAQDQGALFGLEEMGASDPSSLRHRTMGLPTDKELERLGALGVLTGGLVTGSASNPTTTSPPPKPTTTPSPSPKATTLPPTPAAPKTPPSAPPAAPPVSPPPVQSYSRLHEMAHKRVKATLHAHKGDVAAAIAEIKGKLASHQARREPDQEAVVEHQLALEALEARAKEAPAPVELSAPLQRLLNAAMPLARAGELDAVRRLCGYASDRARGREEADRLRRSCKNLEEIARENARGPTDDPAYRKALSEAFYQAAIKARDQIDWRLEELAHQERPEVILAVEALSVATDSTEVKAAAQRVRELAHNPELKAAATDAELAALYVDPLRRQAAAERGAEAAYSALAHLALEGDRADKPAQASAAGGDLAMALRGVTLTTPAWTPGEDARERALAALIKLLAKAHAEVPRPGAKKPSRREALIGAHHTLSAHAEAGDWPDALSKEVAELAIGLAREHELNEANVLRHKMTDASLPIAERLALADELVGLALIASSAQVAKDTVVSRAQAPSAPKKKTPADPALPDALPTVPPVRALRNTAAETLEEIRERLGGANPLDRQAFVRLAMALPMALIGDTTEMRRMLTEGEAPTTPIKGDARAAFDGLVAELKSLAKRQARLWQKLKSREAIARATPLLEATVRNVGDDLANVEPRDVFLPAIAKMGRKRGLTENDLRALQKQAQGELSPPELTAVIGTFRRTSDAMRRLKAAQKGGVYPLFAELTARARELYEMGGSARDQIGLATGRALVDVLSGEWPETGEIMAAVSTAVRTHPMIRERALQLVDGLRVLARLMRGAP